MPGYTASCDDYTVSSTIPLPCTPLSKGSEITCHPSHCLCLSVWILITLHPDSKIARNLRSSSINLNESRAECCARARVIALTRAKSKQNRAHAHVASKQKRVRNVRWIHVENCILSCGEREKIPEPDLDTSDLFIGSHLYSANFELFFKIFHSLPRCKLFFPLDIYNNL